MNSEREKSMIKIGDFAKIFDVTIKTVRFYEEKGLFEPAYVDMYTGYRYYDENNIEEFSKILFLKNLGLSIKEIRSFDNRNIETKINEYKDKIKKLYKDIDILISLSKDEERGKIDMKTFINDESVIGKWELVGVTKNIEEFKNKSYIDLNDSENDFKIKDLYLMENGQEYWVISWTKGYIIINGEAYPYEVENDLMFVKLHSKINKEDYKLVIYKKIDSNKYNIEDIVIKDDMNVEFIEDKNLIGFWKSIDVVKNLDSFDPEYKQFSGNCLYLEKISVSPDNSVIISYNNGKNDSTFYTNGFIANVCASNTLSKYEIKTINNKTYLIIEWKSGDYVFGNMINCYYVLEKIN